MKAFKNLFVFLDMTTSKQKKKKNQYSAYMFFSLENRRMLNAHIHIHTSVDKFLLL